MIPSNPFLPAQLVALAQRKTKELRDDLASARDVTIHPDGVTRWPGVNAATDPRKALIEVAAAVEDNPEMFLGRGPEGVEAFLIANEYPKTTRDGVRRLFGQYLQSLVDVEYRSDPFANTMPFLPSDRSVGVAGDLTRFLTKHDPTFGHELPEIDHIGLNMGEGHNRADTPLSIGPFTARSTKITNYPDWDDPKSNMYLQKRLRYGRQEIPRETWAELREEFEGHDNHRQYLEQAQKDRDDARELPIASALEPGER